MNKMKSLILAGMICFLPQVACNAEGNHNTDKVVDIAQNAPTAKVFNIADVKTNSENKAADFSWTENGKNYTFAEYTKGKVVFLNFWGTWCSPCKAEIPDIIEISNDLQGKDFLVIGMASERPNTKDPLKTVSDFASDKKIPYHVFVSNKEIRDAFGGIPFIPITFIIDKDGKIVETLNGMKTKEEFMSSINKVLK